MQISNRTHYQIKQIVLHFLKIMWRIGQLLKFRLDKELHQIQLKLLTAKNKTDNANPTTNRFGKYRSSEETENLQLAVKNNAWKTD